jgi:hypothetical protein
MLMALVLSHWSGTWVYSSPKSLMVYEIQTSWEQQLAAATYSTSVVAWATLDCLREDQDTKEKPKNWQVPEVAFYSTDTQQSPRLKNHEAPKKMWQPTQENTVLSPKTDPLWSLSNSKVSSCRWLSG